MRAIAKFAALPFFSGCASRSSVATSTSISMAQIRDLKGGSEVNPSVARREESENRTSEVKMKNPSGFLFVLPNISNGVHKLVRSLKTFSQLFVLRKDEDQIDEVEMEIGYPTDVKHVTHIGLDGSTTTNPIIINPNNWDNNNNNNLNNFVPSEFLNSFPSISLRQFELSMAAQAQASLVHTT
ncbi:CRIB domain-containing protein RIC4-like [Benincasa hispida]|uniref:CRIB domain-containing protein RIC4-like n=1 Tax=Benincasa hispida TaxID=102211 RepID=UPI001901E3A0|nr:CRIB domain-containing protein RIC4-like [Benincasa hispida]